MSATYCFLTNSEGTSHAYEVTENGRERTPVCDSAVISATSLYQSTPEDRLCWECESIIS